MNPNLTDWLMVIITFVYVIATILICVFNGKSAKAARESAELMQRELKQSKQPCLTLNVEKIHSSPALSNGRRFMPVEITVENVGDAPAMSVFCVSYLKLQQIADKNGNNIIDMSYGPHFIPCIKIGETTVARVSYENYEINFMFADLARSMTLNWERLKTNPHQNAYRGTELIIHVFYKNISNQWFESKLSREISCAWDHVTKEKTKYNLHEFTFPPRVIEDNTDFELSFAPPFISLAKTTMVDESYVTDFLKKYEEDFPYVFRE